MKVKNRELPFWAYEPFIKRISRFVKRTSNDYLVYDINVRLVLNDMIIYRDLLNNVDEKHIESSWEELNAVPAKYRRLAIDSVFNTKYMKDK